ncbi:diacylglycerol kinase [Halomonas sp. Bachu 37]|uniref:diacylglycerol kinase n=1 Tax=Halomonas kashgarensis TaxID=3084920 RepID=UPI003216A5FB
MKASDTGWRHLLNSTRYSLKGLRSAFRHETAFRQEVGVSLVLLPLAWWVGDEPLEWIVLIGSWLLVMITELLNSAIECVVDRIGAEHHELSGRAKDISSAAVMLSLVVVAVTWGLLLGQKFIG